MSEMLSPMERRVTLRLLAYWEKMRRDRAMPDVPDINSADLEDLWDSCFLVHIPDPAQEDYHYSYLGQAIREAYRFGEAKGDSQELVLPVIGKLATGYNKVRATAKPLLEEGEFRNLSNQLVRYRQCLLPLGEKEEVRAIFGGMLFRIFTVDLAPALQ